MGTVARTVQFIARPGHGEALGRLMVAVAEGLEGAPGCELYLVHRVTERPNEIWVTELWSDQAAVDASLQALGTDAGRAQLAEVMALLAKPPSRTDLEPLGGVWPAAA